MKIWKEITHEKYTVEIEEPTLYIDNRKRGRSGHMSHALTEFSPNCLIDFNSNCSQNRWNGHSPYGWIEYRISRDSGKTFSELCTVPFDTYNRGYGSILFDENNVLHAYAYNNTDEQEMDHAISEDFGKTWTLLKPCHLAKGIRNPQTALIDGIYILHGRAGDTKGFVMYSSENASDWDEGTLIVSKENVSAYYSNNVNLHDENGNFLLIQYSDTYEGLTKVDVKHILLRIKHTK